jgi:hypothetical protein
MTVANRCRRQLAGTYDDCHVRPNPSPILCAGISRVLIAVAAISAAVIGCAVIFDSGVFGPAAVVDAQVPPSQTAPLTQQSDTPVQAEETTPAQTEETTPGTISPAVNEPASRIPTGPGAGFVFGPAVAADRAGAEPGQRTTLTVDGFRSPWVTISVCGNEARRGSVDCNLTGSVTNEFNDPEQAMVLSYVITAPPTTCPCVIRVVGRDATEIAVTPFAVTGHPRGPLVDPPIVDDLFTVTISARTRASGALDAIRAELGGPTNYEVTVRVTNTTTTPLRQVRLSGSVGPNSQERLTTLDLDDPGLLGVGQTWEQTVAAVVPAPSFGEFEWQVAVSGAGPTVVATVTTTHRPWLLIALVLLAVVSFFAVVIRFWVRHRNRTSGSSTDGHHQERRNGADARSADAGPSGDAEGSDEASMASSVGVTG